MAAIADFLGDAVGRRHRLHRRRAHRRGGQLLCPTVLDNVPTSARIFNEEPFGPVASVRGFTRLEDAIAESNRLPYGLAAMPIPAR